MRFGRGAFWLDGRINRLASMALALLVLSFATGCKSDVSAEVAAIKQAAEIEAEPPPQEDFQLSASLDKSVYRPGEVVVIKLVLLNNTDRQVTVRRPDGASCEFYFGRIGDPERMKRDPVVSNFDSLDQMITLQPAGRYERTFLLTRFSHYTGPMTAQVHYEPNPHFTSDEIPKLYSNIVRYEVAGERLFERDSAGLIDKQEAISLAQAKVPGEVQAAEAVLIEDEMGFYKWHVNIKAQAAGQPPVLKSYLIDPYKGKVWREAKPFDPKLAEDPRFKRPANLPTVRPKR